MIFGTYVVLDLNVVGNGECRKRGTPFLPWVAEAVDTKCQPSPAPSEGMLFSSDRFGQITQGLSVACCISEGSSEKQNRRYVCVCRQRVRGRERESKRERGSFMRNCLVWLGSSKIHGLSSASWKSVKAGGTIQSNSEGLRTRGADGVNPSQRSGEDKMRCISLSSKSGTKKFKFILPLPFVRVRPSVDWMMLSHIGEGCLFYWVH